MPPTIVADDRAIANMALRMLGDENITSADWALGANATLRRTIVMYGLYTTVLGMTLSEHPWNFSTKRTTLYAYTLPAATLTPDAGAVTVGATGVEFVAGSAVFAATDVGRQIVTTVSGATGKATITAFTDTTHVDATIDVAFSSVAAIPSQSWRLYHAYPAWGPSRSILVPSDCLRVWRTEDNTPYEVERGYILVSQDVLNCRYTELQTDETLYSAPFVLALALNLAANACESITGSAAKVSGFMKQYSDQLLRAKAVNAQEGTAETLDMDALIDCR